MDSGGVAAVEEMVVLPTAVVAARLIAGVAFWLARRARPLCKAASITVSRATCHALATSAAASALGRCTFPPRSAAAAGGGGGDRSDCSATADISAASSPVVVVVVVANAGGGVFEAASSLDRLAAASGLRPRLRDERVEALAAASTSVASCVVAIGAMRSTWSDTALRLRLATTWWFAATCNADVTYRRWCATVARTCAPSWSGDDPEMGAAPGDMRRVTCWVMDVRSKAKGKTLPRKKHE